MSLAWLVYRLHAGTSDVQVVREMARRMQSPRPHRHGQTISWQVPKAERKLIYREALAHHRRNRALYHDVIEGRI